MPLSDVVRFVFTHPLNRGQRMRALGRLLRWQLGSRLLACPVALPFVDDLHMVVERGMTGATGNYYCGLHEAEDMAFVLHFLKPGDDFYDIGANVGSYSLLAAAAGATRILAFEPAPETARRLRRNIAFNSLQGVVAVQEMALGPADGEVSFSRGSDTTNHVMAEGEAGEMDVVRVGRFDDCFVGDRPSFVKMDVEGFESQVLAGAGAALANASLLGLLVEDNGSGRRYGAEIPIASLLRDHGFEPWRYDPWKRRLVPLLGATQTGNVLFLRHSELAQARVDAAGRFRLVNGWI